MSNPRQRGLPARWRRNAIIPTKRDFGGFGAFNFGAFRADESGRSLGVAVCGRMENMNAKIFRHPYSEVRMCESNRLQILRLSLHALSAQQADGRICPWIDSHKRDIAVWLRALKCGLFAWRFGGVRGENLPLIHPLRKRFRFKTEEKPRPEYGKGMERVGRGRDRRKIKAKIIRLPDKPIA